jgi:hypothetical protein
MKIKYWQTAFAILAVLSASLALAEDFKTVNGKEYKNATVSRVEADGIVLKTKSGITKLYFTELPKEVQERFGYGAINQIGTTEPKAKLDAEYAAEQKAKLEAAWKWREPTARSSVAGLSPAVVGRADDVSATIFSAVAVLVVGGIIAAAVVIKNKQRRERRALLFQQARDWAATVQQNHALPTVATNIMLKPRERAVYSSPSTLYETRAVRNYQAVHSGFRVAKGVYIGGSSGRSISTQQWTALDRGRLTITNQRLVFDGGKEDRTIPLSKVVSVHNSLTEVVVSAQGRQKPMALAVPNPPIASAIIRLCCQVSDPLNLAGDNITFNFNE